MSRKAYTVEERETLRANMVSRAASVFSEKGLRDTCLEDVYVPEGISKTFFYTFFQSKTDLIVEVFRMQTAELLETVRSNVWEYGSVNGLRISIEEVMSGRWFIASLDDQVYLRGLMSEDEFIGFKNDRIVLFADILNILGVPVSRLDLRVFYNMLMSVIWTGRSESGTIPFLYGEAIPATSEIQVERLIEYVTGLRVDAESSGKFRDGMI